MPLPRHLHRLLFWCVAALLSSTLDSRPATGTPPVEGDAASGAALAATPKLPGKPKPLKSSPSSSSLETLWPKVATTTASLLESQHYLRQPLDFHFSKRALDRYFDILDPDRLYFLQSDISDLHSRFEISFASKLKSGNLDPVNAIHGIYLERLTTFCHTALGLAEGDWEFSAPWNTELSREKTPWPADASEAQAAWIAQIGAELLEYRLEGMPQEKATAQIKKRITNLLTSAQSATTKERLSPALLALARACDAHSDYLTQEELEDTENEMRLTRIGIGVTLDSDPAGLRVVGLMPGGPAQKDGRLRMNDRIVAVAEESSPFRELDGMPMPQALALLRGQRDTVVKLKVLPARSNDPAQRVVIPIRREEMRSVDGEAYAKIIQFPSPNNALPLRLGWLVVPAFYGDELDSSGHRSSSVARDVGILLKRFVSEKVDGVVLDFRANLGGLLEEAVEVGGLFCGRLPIVQARAQNGEIEVLKPRRLRSQKPLYSGPLVVLTDHLSASASELVAGALQDYARAVVVGGEQTFGKGSIQTTIPISDYLGGRTHPPVGGLALTVGKFYRVNGQSTQIRGVLPDVVLPSTLDLPHEGESALVDPLPHDAIQTLLNANAPSFPTELLETLRQRSAARIQNSAAFAAVISERDTLRKTRLENQLSLEEAERRSALETAHRSYSEREANLGTPIKGARFCRLLLEDANLKRLKFFEEDPLASRDPESIATETEVLHILMDLTQLEANKPLTAALEETPAVTPVRR